MSDQERNRERMVKAIREQLDDDRLRDVAEHGADGGFPGFSYYSDTVAFYNEHADAIWDMLGDLADDMGETPIGVIAGFRIAKDIQSDDQFKNALAWFALEEVARDITENDEDEDDDD